MRRLPGRFGSSSRRCRITTQNPHLYHAGRIMIPVLCHSIIRTDMQPFRKTLGSLVTTYRTILAAACRVHPDQFAARLNITLLLASVLGQVAPCRVHNRFSKVLVPHHAGNIELLVSYRGTVQHRQQCQLVQKVFSLASYVLVRCAWRLLALKVEFLSSCPFSSCAPSKEACRKNHGTMKFFRWRDSLIGLRQYRDFRREQYTWIRSLHMLSPL